MESVSDPDMPYEQTIATYDWDNGDYELRAELDVAEEDTSIEASVSTTFENYLVTMETDGFFELFSGSQTYVFISEPGGDVLRMLDVNDYTDGTVNLLPPSQLESDAPEYVNVTLAQFLEGSSFNQFLIETDVGLDPWSTIYQYGSSSSSTSSTEVEMDFSNFYEEFLGYIPFARAGLGGFNTVSANVQSDGSIEQTFPISEDLEGIMYAFYSRDQAGGPVVPKYHLDEGIQDSLANAPDSLRYDVANDFEPIDVVEVSLPSSDFALNTYFYNISVLDDSWDEGSYGLQGLLESATGDPASIGLYIPQIDNRLYEIRMTGMAPDGNNYTQVTTGSSLPDAFNKFDTSVDITASTIDDVQFSIDGSADFAQVIARTGSRFFQEWSVTMPDTLDSFTYPNIADSLNGEVGFYNRSDLQLDNITVSDYEEFDDYSDLLVQSYAAESSRLDGPFNYLQISAPTSSSQSSKVKSLEEKWNMYQNGNQLNQSPAHLQIPFERPTQKRILLKQNR